MKMLTNLSAKATDAPFIPQGVISELNYEDPNCPGFFVGIALTTAGLRLKARRPDGGSVAISLDEIIRLARGHAPEVFADAKMAARSKAALVNRGKPPARNPGTQPKERDVK
jgi:hypothetical protein